MQLSSSYAYTYERTFTITHAYLVAAKVAADLRQLQRFYDRPTDQEIQAFTDELAILLAGRYVESVEYGFEKDGVKVLTLHYHARWDGTLVSQDRAGRVYAYADVSGASWLLNTFGRVQTYEHLPESGLYRPAALLAPST